MMLPFSFWVNVIRGEKKCFNKTSYKFFTLYWLKFSFFFLSILFNTADHQSDHHKSRGGSKESLVSIMSLSLEMLSARFLYTKLSFCFQCPIVIALKRERAKIIKRRMKNSKSYNCTATTEKECVCVCALCIVHCCNAAVRQHWTNVADFII